MSERTLSLLMLAIHIALLLFRHRTLQQLSVYEGLVKPYTMVLLAGRLVGLGLQPLGSFTAAGSCASRDSSLPEPGLLPGLL